MDYSELNLAIIQARLTSTRFPGKVLRKVGEYSIIEIIVKRLERSKLLDKIVIAIPDNESNVELANFLEQKKLLYFKGSEHDVLSRFVDCAKFYKAATVVRITGDCPFVDAKLVDNFINMFNQSNIDYLSNTNPPSYPDGLDAEVFSFNCLSLANKGARDRYDREHVTTFIKENKKFKKMNLFYEEDFSDLRLTLDEKEDLDVIKSVFKKFDSIFFDLKEIINLYNQDAELFNRNSHLKRNQNTKMSSGQKLYKKAKQIIPGGNMLLSKRPEMFLPDLWPSYYSKSKGCHVWDLDGNKLADTCFMGIGTNILGYANDKVDHAVLKTIKNGNLTTLNCPEEVYLAERLIELNPWAHMVKFARTGGEANSVAIRIARAATGKDKVAICGYHGWHDWYLSANLGKSKELDGHLLPGLEPRGVPRNLAGTTFSFNYNDLESLKKIIYEEDIGVIKMEVMRNHLPKNNFLQKVRDLATKNNIVLIFDECTSGFRETNSGLHKKFSVEPDIAIYGKTLGNGYAITAIVGKKEVMDHAQTTFISSTFWTERIGPTAALASLEEMERVQSWEYVTKTGKCIKDFWKEIFEKYNFDYEISGIDPLPVFSSPDKGFINEKSFISFDMLQKGFLASNAIYVCTSHTDKVLATYYESFEETISKMATEISKNGSIEKLVKFTPAHSGFKRLN